MARHDQNDGQPQSSFDALKLESERLAEDFEISEERLLACLSSLVAAFRVDHTRRLDLTHRAVRLIRDAITALGEHDGIRYLEQIDPQRLDRRLQAIEHIRSELVPFCSLDELHNQLRNFLTFQDETEQFLVKTGLPPKTFNESPWVFLHLGRLYDTRCTRSPYPQRPSLPRYRKEHGPLDDEPEPINSSPLPVREPYTWIKYPPETVFSLNKTETCQYEDASFLPGLNPRDAKSVEGLRPSIWAARRAVIAEVVQTCGRGEAGGLLERCLEILNTKLGRATILFLLRMDGFYLGGDPRAREQVETTPKMSPGGLTNLVEVIGHVEDELRTGRIDRLIRSIPQKRLGTVFDDEEPSVGYLKSTRTAEAIAVDSALDEFSERAERSRHHWGGVCHRFAKWLDPDYRVSVSAEVRPEYAERIASLLSRIIPYLETQIAAGYCPVSLPTLQPSNQFQYDGSSWSFTFDRKTTAHPHLDGFFYLAELLKAPDQEVDAVELRHRIATWKAKGSNLLRNAGHVLVAGDNTDINSPDALRTTTSGDAGLTCDAQALAECRARLTVIKSQLVSAEQVGRGAEATKLRDERDDLQKYINANTNNRGQPQRLKSDRKNAGDAVRKAIDTAIESLRKSHPDLHRHLARYVERGPTCRYAPPTPVDWEF